METQKQINQRNVLWVDSDSELIHTVQDYAEKQKQSGQSSANFLYAKNVKEALKVLKERKIDLIVLEIVLPFANGYGLLNIIRKQPGKPSVIIYTRLKGSDDMDKLASYGVDNIFIKQLTKWEEVMQVVTGKEEQKVDLAKLLPTLKDKMKSASDTEAPSQLKIVQCPQCNTILGRKSRFCNNCGKQIVDKEDDSKKDDDKPGQITIETEPEESKKQT